MIREMTPCLFSMYQYFQKCFIKNNFTEKKNQKTKVVTDVGK